MIHKASMILAGLVIWASGSPAVRADEVATDDNLQLTLPSSIYAVPELETSIYFDNLILTQTPELYEFRVTCDVGDTDGVRWFVTPHSSQSGRHPFEISVSSKDGQLIAQKTATLFVAPREEQPPRDDPLKLLIIGDSLTHATVYPNEVARLLSLPNNPEWTMLGTHKPASAAPGVAHEGYGGWTWDRFVNKYEPNPDGTYRKRSSPFVFLADDGRPQLNVARYLDESCQGQRPDFVVIMLGINDCFSAPPDNPKGIDDRISSMFAHADRLLAAIHQSAPAAQIGICLTTPPNSRQAAFEANYQDRYTRWGWKRIQHRLVQRQLEYVSAKNDRRISVIPTELNLDPVGGYPENNGVHPNAVGYKQIGATIFSWLKWQLSAAGKTPFPAAPEYDDVFLLPYFLGNGESGIYFAYSYDGYHFQWLNDGDVVLPAPSWEGESLTRDPSILFHEGIFHMVWTTSWESRTIGYASSGDLLTWNEPRRVDVWKDRPDVKNTWAPELHWDPEQQEFVVLFSSTTDKELADRDDSADPHGYDHRTFAIRTRDFRSWSAPALFFSPEPEYSVIDPFVAQDDNNTPNPDDDRWVMVIKNEMAVEQGGKNLRLTFSEHMQGPFETTLTAPVVGAGTQIVDQMGEGPSLFRRSGSWFLYWDAPESDFSYCLATSPDLITWTNRSASLQLPAEHMRHGTVLMCPQAALANTLPEISNHLTGPQHQ